MKKRTRLRRICTAFDKIHAQLSIIRSHIETLENVEAIKHFSEMEIGMLAPMRHLRLALNIPYNWLEVKRPPDPE